MTEGPATARLPIDLRDRLELCLVEAPPAHGAIASHFLAHLADLPFETAASVAQRIGVSEATVGRFCRAIGYRHFKEMKAAIRSGMGDKAWLAGDRLAEFAARQKAGNLEISRGMERELAAVIANYETAAGPDFARVVARLARAERVFVAGFQTERGLGQYLAHQLQYLRPGVELLDQTGGHFAELLIGPPGETALVLIDGRRYSHLTQDLALAARKAGIGVTLITDPYCPWARQVADEVLVVQTDLNQFWDATPAVASLSSLIVNAVFAELGTEVEARMSRISSLYNAFTGHVGGLNNSRK